MYENVLWKDIPEYEGSYQASTSGLIRSFNKVTYTKYHGFRKWKSKILKTRGKSKSGYRVVLWKDGLPKSFLTARLIAFTWVSGYKEGYTVNHKNGNRYDNRVENLEWLSLGDNIRHGFNNGLYSTQKEITLKEIATGRELKFRSMAQASYFLGQKAGYISNTLKKNRKVKTNTYELVGLQQYKKNSIGVD